jgi:hypothetical protein
MAPFSLHEFEPDPVVEFTINFHNFRPPCEPAMPHRLSVRAHRQDLLPSWPMHGSSSFFFLGRRTQKKTNLCQKHDMSRDCRPSRAGILERYVKRHRAFEISGMITRRTGDRGGVEAKQGEAESLTSGEITSTGFNVARPLFVLAWPAVGRKK